MTLLLDTHFLIWILLDSHRLKPHDWILHHQPWGVSPVSLLEIQFLAEVGRIEVRNPTFSTTFMTDQRFVVDEIPLMSLVRKALPLEWTRDPFDRLLAAHSSARRIPLCTLDSTLQKHHPLISPELSR